MSLIDTITIGLRTTEESCPSDSSTAVITLSNFSHHLTHTAITLISHLKIMFTCSILFVCCCLALAVYLMSNVYNVSEGDNVIVMLVTNIPHKFQFDIVVNASSRTGTGTITLAHVHHAVQWTLNHILPSPQLALTL